jgi:hypothetical protein
VTGQVQLDPAQDLRVVVSAVFAGLLIELYATWALKRYLARYDAFREAVSNPLLAGPSAGRAFDRMLGAQVTRFLRDRTLVFPAFELILAAAVLASVAVHGFGGELVHLVVYVLLALPLSIISARRAWSFWTPVETWTPGFVTVPGALIGVLAAMVPGSGMTASNPALARWLTGTLALPEPLAGAAIAVLGALAVFGVLGVMWWVSPRSLGFGAVKCGLMVGAFVGFSPRLLVAMLVGSALATVYGTFLQIRRAPPTFSLPPFLCGGAYLVLLLASPAS